MFESSSCNQKAPMMKLEGWKIRTDILKRKQEIEQWILEHQSKSFICRELRCKPETLNYYLKEMNIVYMGNRGAKGIKNAPNYKTAEEYIKSDSHIKSHKLKTKLIKDGVKENKCELCGETHWLHHEIPLELHHRDGNHYNNAMENLEVLCPNCHSLRHRLLR